MLYVFIVKVSLLPALQLMVKNLQFEDGKMIAAAQYFSAGSSVAVELNEEEKNFAEQMRVRLPKWQWSAKQTFVI